jgi:hypothetical protein
MLMFAAPNRNTPSGTPYPRRDGRTLARLEATSEISKLDRTVGADGKRYPTRRNARPNPDSVAGRVLEVIGKASKEVVSIATIRDQFQMTIPTMMLSITVKHSIRLLLHEH